MDSYAALKMSGLFSMSLLTRNSKKNLGRELSKKKRKYDNISSPCANILLFVEIVYTFIHFFLYANSFRPETKRMFITCT